MKVHSLLPAALVGVAICIVQQQISTASLSAEKIQALAKEITVRIDGEGMGSGVIIERKDNKYIVLTCRHIFYSAGGLGTYLPGKYEITTSDGQTYPIYSRKELSGIDLAVLEFESNKKYRSVELANSDKIRKSAAIYSAGWTRESSKLGRVYTLTIGYFKERLRKPENGYALVITNSVLPGMSGGPMLDQDGRLVGIHGQVDPRNKSLRLGIPINTFLASNSQIAQSMPPSSPGAEKPNPALEKKPSIPNIPLKSSSGLNYTKLKNLLAQGKWRESDFETSNLLLILGKRTKEGWLRAEDINVLSCDDLRTIDRLWVAYSQGKFGFSVQKKVYQSLGGKRNYDSAIWNKFGDRLGWRKYERWLYYPELTFDLSAPEGSFPIPVRYNTLDSRKAASIFISRLPSCQL